MNKRNISDKTIFNMHPSKNKIISLSKALKKSLRLAKSNKNAKYYSGRETDNFLILQLHTVKKMDKNLAISLVNLINKVYSAGLEYDPKDFMNS